VDGGFYHLKDHNRRCFGVSQLTTTGTNRTLSLVPQQCNATALHQQLVFFDSSWGIGVLNR
jgi:hypothetical protein